jgi:hypothetical protein
VVNWNKFELADFEVSFNEEKLAAHGIERFEVLEVLRNGFVPVRNKGYADRYRLLGRTDSGRPLELVVVVVNRNTLRFITGWPL